MKKQNPGFNEEKNQSSDKSDSNINNSSAFFHNNENAYPRKAKEINFTVNVPKKEINPTSCRIT